MSSDKSSKMTIFATLCMTTGTIIGAGIFGSIPEAAALMGGAGIELAYIAACLAIIVRFLPTIVTGSVLPAPFCTYMHATRLLNPTLGFSQVIFGFNFIFILSTLATVFAIFFRTYLPIDMRLLGVGSLLLFCLITCLGVKANTVVQNIMVILLVAALLLFIVLGFPHIKPEFFSLGGAFAPQIPDWAKFGAAVGILSATLQGGHNVMYYADEVEEPSKAIPIGFLGATVICTVLFMLVSAVAVGVMHYTEGDNLRKIAGSFMGPTVMHFFIICGAVFAILTSINGLFVSASRMIGATAKDKVLPEWIDKRNRFGVAYPSVIFLGLASSIIVAFSVRIGVLLSAFSFLTIVCNMLLFIPPLIVKKRYPNMYEHAYMKLTPFWVLVLCVLGFLVSIWQVWALSGSMGTNMFITVIVWLGGWYVYFFIRRAKLKGEGIDLDAIMRAPYPEWEQKEKEYAKQAAKR